MRGLVEFQGINNFELFPSTTRKLIYFSVKSRTRILADPSMAGFHYGTSIISASQKKADAEFNSDQFITAPA